MTEKIALTIEEAAQYTGIGRNTLRQLIRWNSIPALHIGRKTLIRTDALNEFLILNQNTDLRDRGAIHPVPRSVS
ncbi:MAG: helix-turn-helix domain-containing protein [Firmicutes bacterium]|jgi:excisionase family DNA binding protein|nr:helix-turn-helix domain-containing protein [Bacillota bacterium]